MAFWPPDAVPATLGGTTTSKTKTALSLFSGVIVISAVERILRIAIIVAFWPAIAVWADVDRELAGPGARQSAGLAGAGTVILVIMIVELLMVAVGFHLLRSGRAEFPSDHSRRITRAGVAMISYAVLIFVGNIGLSVGLGTFFPWIGYTLSFDSTRYAAFTMLNVGLAALAGLSAFWIPERLFAPRARKVALAAFALGVGSALAVSVVGLGVLATTPFPASPDQAPFVFAIPEILGDAIAIVSLALWLLAYVGTVGRFRRGELVAKPPPPVYSAPPPYIPPYVPPSPPAQP